MIAIIVTVANGAVRLSIGLRLVGFIHVFQEGDANGRHKVDDLTPFRYHSHMQCDGI